MEIPEGYGNCRFIFTCSGADEPMGFSLGFASEGFGDAELAASEIGNLFAGVFIPTTSGVLVGWSFYGTVFTQTLGGEPVVGEYTPNIGGTGTGASLVTNTAILVRKTSVLGGRKNRGRMFVPPFNLEEDVCSNAGLLEPTAVAAQQDAWNDFYGGLITADRQPVILHSDPAGTPTPVTGFQVQSRVATQRRRLR